MGEMITATVGRSKNQLLLKIDSVISRLETKEARAVLTRLYDQIAASPRANMYEAIMIDQKIIRILDEYVLKYLDGADEEVMISEKLGELLGKIVRKRGVLHVEKKLTEKEAKKALKRFIKEHREMSKAEAGMVFEEQQACANGNYKDICDEIDKIGAEIERYQFGCIHMKNEGELKEIDEEIDDVLDKLDNAKDDQEIAILDEEYQNLLDIREGIQDNIAYAKGQEQLAEKERRDEAILSKSAEVDNIHTVDESKRAATADKVSKQRKEQAARSTRIHEIDERARSERARARESRHAGAATSSRPSIVEAAERRRSRQLERMSSEAPAAQSAAAETETESQKSEK